ncbi:MAG: hypothetical protein JXA52_08280, partial [Planctomycetes bacterium]|nr:hypothetical protein [Planctomycetota bacterium]
MSRSMMASYAVMICGLLVLSLPSYSAEGQAGAGLIQPDDLEYRGAFRLPDGPEEYAWLWSGQALAYFPEGDPGGEADGYPGSIFGTGHDWNQYVSEISIPQPVISD